MPSYPTGKRLLHLHATCWLLRMRHILLTKLLELSILPPGVMQSHIPLFIVIALDDGISATSANRSTFILITESSLHDRYLAISSFLKFATMFSVLLHCFCTWRRKYALHEVN